jgi:acyl-CoA synthetase (AMP-forming)/AMP-acid ligase II/acyl carrier protein
VPKGVVLTHKNILTNIRAIGIALNEDTSYLLLNWMPFYHDMGLIGFHLTPVYYCVDQFHINTMDFVKHPLLWLDSLEKYGATITAAPNFGQALLLSRLERQQKKKWDLSSVRVILNGAEPISVAVMHRFMEKLSGFQLDAKTMFPVYGLAEATLAVTFPPLDEMPQIESLNRRELQLYHRAVSADAGDTTAIDFVNVGFPVADCEVRIVDEADNVVSDGNVGHIQIRGDNVTAGYYGNPEGTRDAFCGEWLRTGDLGFIRKERLCVTGRTKDILFINGQNYYAHDIENVAQQVEGVRDGRAAVCGWHHPQAGRDKLLLFLGSSNPKASAGLFVKVKQHLQRILGLTVDVTIPLKSNQFPKTTSGKLQRYKLRERFEQGAFDAEIEQAVHWIAVEEAKNQKEKTMPGTTREKILHRLWYEELLLKPEEVGIHDRFAELGGKSIHAVSILAGLEKLYNVRIHSEVLAEYHTIAEIVAYIDAHPIRRGRHHRFRG